MHNQGRGRSSIQRLELMEEESRLRGDINTLRYKRQNLIDEIKQKRSEVGKLKERRDSLNAQVRELINKGKEHLKKRDELHGRIKKLKEERSGITRGIKPKADRIRSEKEVRWKLNRAAHSSEDEIIADFEASLKTLFENELSLKDEVIMVEMVMDVQKRFTARKNADKVSKDIRKTWKDIKGIEEKATSVTTEIITLAAEGEKEHQAAMELFDRKNELSTEGQEAHESYVDLVKNIRSMSKQIDDLSQEIDEKFSRIKPMQRKLDNARLTRREEQRLEQLKTAKHKMETSGKIDLNDLRVLLEMKALDLVPGRGSKASTAGKSEKDRMERKGSKGKDATEKDHPKGGRDPKGKDHSKGRKDAKDQKGIDRPKVGQGSKGKDRAHEGDDLLTDVPGKEEKDGRGRKSGRKGERT